MKFDARDKEYDERDETQNERSNLTLVLFCVTLGIFLFLRAYSDVFLYPAIAVGLAAVVRARMDVVLGVLFFTLPLGSIFKAHPDHPSFFTAMFIGAALRFLSTYRLKASLLTSCSFFCAYLLATSGADKIVAIGTIAVGFFLTYYALNVDSSFKTITIAYAAGVILSSSIAALDAPIADRFIEAVQLKLGEEKVVRFAGLHGNPNYFTLDVSLAASGLAVLALSSRPSPLCLPFFASLTIFGFMSVSKSFFASWALLLAWILFSLAQSKNTFLILKILLMISLCCGIMCCVASDSVNSMTARFAEDSGASWGERTTGRSDIWAAYLQTIWNNVKILAFGAGVDGELVDKRGTHNSYLEALYTLGVLGLPLYACALRSALSWEKERDVGATAEQSTNSPETTEASGGVEKRGLIRFAPLAVLATRFLGVGIFTNDVVWFYITYAVMALRDGEPKRQLREEKLGALFIFRLLRREERLEQQLQAKRLQKLRKRLLRLQKRRGKR